jgi:hypothetical protein
VKEKVLYKKCVECGKDMVITLKDDKTYEGGNYYGTIKKGIGDYAVYELTKQGKFKRCIPLHKLLFRKLIDLKKLLLHQYEEIEIWVCDECEGGG